jgi:hypothetical protein
MQCPKCGFDNIDKAKFCNECGQNQELKCPGCGVTNPPGSKFCNDCGHDLTQSSPAAPKALSFDEKIAKIQKYLPPGITEKILSQRNKIEGEKRQVTVMFCDMKSFTSLSEKLGPEAVYAMTCPHKRGSLWFHPHEETEADLPSMIKYFQSCLMRAKVLRHDQDIELTELFACYQNYKVTWGKGWTARNIGDILLHIGSDHLSDAEVWFQKAIEADTRNGFRWQLATNHACYADWFKKKGDIPGAKEQLTKAIDLFRECGADGWVTRTGKTLAELS